MKNIIGSLFLFFAFVNTSIAITDNREYVDWKDYPNIVKITSSGWKKMGQCTGTEIGKYVITAAHCVEDFDSFTILKNNDVQIDAKIKSVGNAKIPRDDWAILSLPYETESKYELSENLSGDSGALYGFGALRILTDEELSKVRQYLREHALLDTDELVDLLHKDIPDVGYIYNDGDKLKKSPCSGIRKTGKGIQAACFSSSGNSGGGLFINDNKIIGIDSSGNIMEYGAVFAPTKVVKKAIQHIQSGKCDENFVVENIFKKQINYSSHKKIGDYYILSGNARGIWEESLRDLCGNIILEYVDMSPESVKSIEYSNGVYKFIKPLGIPILSCAYGNGLNKVLASKVEDGDYEEIVLIDENDSKSESPRMSIDGGKTFYNSLYDLLASMFTQQEINEMPEDWKKCLGIIK